jgi:hypothetical protein
MPKKFRELVFIVRVQREASGLLRQVVAASLLAILPSGFGVYSTWAVRRQPENYDVLNLRRQPSPSTRTAARRTGRLHPCATETGWIARRDHGKMVFCLRNRVPSLHDLGSLGNIRAVDVFLIILLAASCENSLPISFIFASGGGNALQSKYIVGDY